jgi:HK97 gp10 family phage protein
MAGFRNKDKLQRRLRAIASPKGVKFLESAMFAGADLIADQAKHLIMAGSAAGQSGGKHQHVPSASGQPPNNEFGDLIRGIEVSRTGKLEYTVSASAAHSAPLEFGTSTMAARPFMRPARDAKRREAQALWAKAVDRVVKGAAD